MGVDQEILNSEEAIQRENRRWITEHFDDHSNKNYYNKAYLKNKEYIMTSPETVK